MSASPANCRNRLVAEGKPYPRSGCAHCRVGGITGCPYEKAVHGNASISPATGIDAAWVVGYLPSDAPEEHKQAIHDAFAEFAALTGGQ